MRARKQGRINPNGAWPWWPKGASVKNCVLMQGTAVEQGVEMEYIVTDKNVTITERRHLKGNENFPVYVEKGTTV